MKYYLFLLFLILITSCSPRTTVADEQASTPIPEPTIPVPTGPLTLTSPAFIDEGTIPLQYGQSAFQVELDNRTVFTCASPAQSINLSPALSWQNVPVEAKSLVLTMVDQLHYAYADSPAEAVFTHWIVFNIPPTSTGLPYDLPSDPPPPDGTLQGSNDYPPPYNVDYGGPCPGAEKHIYVFTLYALDTLLDLPAGADLDEVQSAIKLHILEQAELKAYFTGE